MLCYYKCYLMYKTARHECRNVAKIKKTVCIAIYVILLHCSVEQLRVVRLAFR